MVEMNFAGQALSCLDTVLQETSSGEQTQEIKLPDGMPDIGHVLCAWGQPILRGKEWRSDSISFTGGMMVWVLYRSEEDGAEKCIDAWIPFQMQWDLPAGTPEGTIRLRCSPRFVDARPVSPRKIMVRAGMSAMVTALAPRTAEVSQIQKQGDGVELLKVTYPVRLPREAGEKAFRMDEEVSLPESFSQPEKLICYRMEARITDKKVLAGKLVFRGNAMLHVLYADQNGKLTGWDFEVPFSQFAELEREYSSDAQADILPSITNLELELLDGGSLRLRCGVVAQYLITDKCLLEIVEDAYCPARALELHTRILELPVVLENKRETVTGEAGISAGADSVADICFLPEFPRQMQTESGIRLEMPGTIQVLYYDPENNLCASSARWEGSLQLMADERCTLTAVPGIAQVQADIGGAGLQVKAELPLEVVSSADQGFCLVTGVEMGEENRLDPGRPSLILRRAGTKRLWDIAKDCGSTVEAIRQANGIQAEPVQGQMLLIPVP